jgi:hypothetical protein
MLLVAGLCVSGSACSDSVTPTNPSGIPNVAGTWSGTYHIKTCTDTINSATSTINSGTGTLCATVVDSSSATNPASTQPVQLTLTQQKDQLTGTLSFSGWYVLNVPVTGSIVTSGRVYLQGSGTITDTGCPTTTGTFTLSTWVSDLNRPQDGLTGVFTFAANKRLNACVFDNLTMQADTVVITRKPSSSSTTTTSVRAK